MSGTLDFGDQKQNFLPHCMKLIIYIYVIHHATNQLFIKQNINVELSRFFISLLGNYQTHF